jgi:hypothetical protein
MIAVKIFTCFVGILLMWAFFLWVMSYAAMCLTIKSDFMITSIGLGCLIMAFIFGLATYYVLVKINNLINNK